MKPAFAGNRKRRIGIAMSKESQRRKEKERKGLAIRSIEFSARGEFSFPYVRAEKSRTALGGFFHENGPAVLLDIFTID